MMAASLPESAGPLCRRRLESYRFIEFTSTVAPLCPPPSIEDALSLINNNAFIFIPSGRVFAFTQLKSPDNQV